MPYVCHATWVAQPGREEEVRDALTRLAPLSRAEPENLIYLPYADPDHRGTFHIFEVYTDEQAFQAHADSDHFAQWALGTAIPLLSERTRVFARTLEDAW